MVFDIQFKYEPYEDESSFIKSDNSFVTAAGIEKIDNGEDYSYRVTLKDNGLVSLFGVFEILKHKTTGQWMIDGSKGLNFASLQHSILIILM